MIQFFEESNDVSNNCGIGPLDEPFYIPIRRNDPLYLRVQLPYHYVTLNGGGIPNGNKVDMKIVDVAGTTTLCDYGDATSGRFKLGYLNDSTNRIAEYQFFTGIGMEDASFDNHNVYGFDVLPNDIVSLQVDSTIYSFVFGVDEIPYPLWEWDTNKIAIVLSDTEASLATVDINGASGILDTIIDVPQCAYENLDCFRIRIDIELTTYGNTITFFSKPYKIIRCDEPSLWLYGKYPNGSIDCAGQKHEASGDAFFKNLLMMRIVGELDRVPNEISKEFNERSYNFKSSLIKKKVLKCDPVPTWYIDAFETLMLAKETRINNEQLYAKDVQTFTENIDINGVTYQNINLPLQSSKCENIFVC